MLKAVSWTMMPTVLRIARIPVQTQQLGPKSMRLVVSWMMTKTV